MTSTAPAAKPAAKSKPAEPEATKPPTAAQQKNIDAFADLAGALAVADVAAQTAGHENKQANAARASLASDVMFAAFKTGLSADAIRETLLSNGVLKGTASKIVTVASAVAAGSITTGEFKTLYEAYSKVSLANRVAKINAFNAKAAKEGKPLKPVPGLKAGEVAPPVIKEVEKVVMPAPKDALAVILKDIREAGDEDMILDRASYWVTELTTQITKITSKITDGSKSDD